MTGCEWGKRIDCGDVEGCDWMSVVVLKMKTSVKSGLTESAIFVKRWFLEIGLVKWIMFFSHYRSV